MVHGQTSSSVVGQPILGEGDDFASIYHALKALTQVMGRQMRTGNDRPNNGSTMEQFWLLKPPIFKGTSKPVYAEAWIAQTHEVFCVIVCRND